MKFTRIRVDRLGPIRDLDTGRTELPGLVVVCGPNEAGKTSLFTGLRTLLHGFYPAARDRHPLAPWDGDEAELRAEYLDREGRATSVHRRLLSAPWGRLDHGNGKPVNLRNDALPCARELPRDVYEQMFTITLPQLARLRDSTGWKSVRDRLVTGMEASDLASPGRVANALEGEARALWRPSRNRGSMEDKLGDDEKALRDRLAAARVRDRDLRQASRRREEVAVEIEEAQEVRIGLEARLKQVRTLLPAGERLDRFDRLLRDAGDPEALLALPADPVDRLEELSRTQAREEEQRMEAATKVEELRSKVPELDSGSEALLSRSDAVEKLTVHAPLVTERRSRSSALRSDLQRIDDDLEPLILEVFGESGKGISSDDLRGVAISDLRSRIEQAGEIDRRRAHVEDLLVAARARHASQAGESGVPAGIMAASGLAAATLLAAILLLVAGGVDEPSSLGLVLLLAGSVLGVGTWLRWAGWRQRVEAASREHEERAQELDDLEGRIATLSEERVLQQDAALAAVSPLPIRKERLDRLPHELPGELERLRDLLRERDRAERELNEIQQEEARFAGELHSLLTDVPAFQLPDDPAQALPLLEERLRVARARSEARTDAELAVREAERELERCAESADRGTEAVRLLGHALEQVEPGQPLPEAARRARDRRESLENARRMARELEAEFGDLQQLRDRVSEARATIDDEGGAEGRTDSREEVETRIIQELEAANQELDILRNERATLTAALRPGKDDASVATIEASIERIQEQRAELRRERDRLWLLSRVVRVAERRFRDAHQPELIRRASRHLGRITGGRYERLILGNEEDGDALLLQAPHLPEPLPAEEPLSTGTCEQVYLALRLAVVELVEGEGEPLPLILDEVLVHWDAERRSRGLDLLEALAEERQVFLFTCHPAIAEEVETRGGFRLDLQMPGERPPATEPEAALGRDP